MNYHEAVKAIGDVGVAVDTNLDIYGDTTDQDTLPEIWRFAHRIAAARARQQADALRTEAGRPELFAGYRNLMAARAEAFTDFAINMERIAAGRKE